MNTNVNIPSNYTVEVPKPQFELPPAGTYAAACCGIIHLGTHLKAFGNNKPKKRQDVMLEFEPFGIVRTTGEPFVIRRRYNFTLGKGSALSADLKTWLGVVPEGFNFLSVAGRPALINISHDLGKADASQTYANLTGIMALPKGQTVGAPVSGVRILWLKPGIFDLAVFDSLSDFLKQEIETSFEYAALKGLPPPAAVAVAPPVNADTPSDPDDEIPF